MSPKCKKTRTSDVLDGNDTLELFQNSQTQVSKEVHLSLLKINIYKQTIIATIPYELVPFMPITNGNLQRRNSYLSSSIYWPSMIVTFCSNDYINLCTDLFLLSENS